MPLPNSLARSKSLTSRVKRNPGTPKMNGAPHHSRVAQKNMEPNSNENKLPSTPCSPSSSSGHNSITVAERRQTKSSKYLVSEDFKSDFASKLNRFRQRETPAGPSELVAINAADCDETVIEEEDDHDSHETDNNYTTTDTTTTTETTTTDISVYTDIIDSTSHLPEIPQTTSPGEHQIHSAQECTLPDIELEIEPQTEPQIEQEGYNASADSNQEKQPSSGPEPPSSQACDEDPEEQSARYEVISKLADQLAEQIEQNDSLLYDLGVVRSNNARLQAVAADREDEVACLNQRNRHLESIILKLNSSQPIEHTQTHSNSAHEAHLNLLNQTHAGLCQLLALGLSQRQSPSRSNPPESKFDTQMGHVRRYSWSGPPPKYPGSHSDPIPHNTASRTIKLPDPSDQPGHRALPSGDLVAGWTGLVDDTDRQSLKAHIHRLQTELAHRRSVCMATEASLRPIIEAIARQRPTATCSEKKLQGLGLFTSSTPSRVLRPLNANTGETPTIEAGGWTTRTVAIPDEQHATSSPLLALTNFGFGGWGRKQPESSSPPKPAPDEDARIPSSLAVSDGLSPAAGVAPQPAEKEPVQPFMRFGLRSFFIHQSPGSQPSAKLDPAASSPLSKKVDSKLLEQINNENAPLSAPIPLAPLPDRIKPTSDGPKVPARNPDRQLVSGGGAIPHTPDGIVI
ncbi:hypothetical protein PCASD_16559 [Puccinia coronata f. sp. avenae]|uniref:Uncharacterized protein n=1 Tax=Puccinia coronata f. sp. avenae TaxID=200324 RepID=A0A2N5T1V4_9BASI|nr:hypothetical protein PCASD_16559 [Puccinia coronata f. sp. avenae]